MGSLYLRQVTMTIPQRYDDVCYQNPQRERWGDSAALDRAYRFSYSWCWMVSVRTTRRVSVTDHAPSRPAGRERPSVTVDVVVVARQPADLRILLVRRKKPPFQGYWALPGGFVNPHEPLEMAARRELFEETGITSQRMEQLCTVGTPGRDPRGWTITIVYMAVVGKDEADTFHLQPSSDAEEAGWFDTNELPQVAFDHIDIIDRALSHLGPLPA